MDRILDFEYYRSPIDTAWDRELFPSKYPANSEWDWIDTDRPENAIDNRPITYKFNDYGFRCDVDFDDIKIGDYKILVSGCSMTVGVGVAFEDTWPKQFKRIIQKNRIFETLKNIHEPKDITLWNLAQSSASPDYVVRSIYKTIDLFAPDVVAVCWPPDTRFEQPDKSHRNKLRDFQMQDNEFPDRFEVPGWPEYQWRKNIEFLEMMCMMKNVQCIHGPGHDMCMFGIDPRDGARDGIHPDEAWHKEFAELVFTQYHKNINR